VPSEARKRGSGEDPPGSTMTCSQVLRTWMFNQASYGAVPMTAFFALPNIPMIFQSRTQTYKGQLSQVLGRATKWSPPEETYDSYTKARRPMCLASLGRTYDILYSGASPPNPPWLALLGPSYDLLSLGASPPRPPWLGSLGPSYDLLS
jgi:hypothetical protein